MMSNRRPSDPDKSHVSGDPDKGRVPGDPERIDDAFAARLASATPRLAIDATAIHYKAGYQAGLAEMRGERRLYRSLVAAAATVALAAFGWEVYVHGSLRAERAALIAKLDEFPAPGADDQIASSDIAETTTEPAPSTDIAVALAPEAEVPTSPARSTQLANDAFQRRLLSGRRNGVSSMRWSDLYYRSPSSFSAERRTVPTTTNVSTDGAAAPAPWSAFPSPQSLNALIEEGI